MIRLGREVCCHLPAALDREWLVTNGIGGYASSTIVGANTRRYHGLLVAAMEPPWGRTVLLAKIDEEVVIGDRTYYLGTNEYPNDTIHPGGFVHLEEFRLEGSIPTFRYVTADAILDKTIWMEHGSNTTYIRYFLHPSSSPATLRLITFANHRHYHSETRGSADWDFSVTPLPGGCEVRAYEGAFPYRLLAGSKAEFVPTGIWYWRFVYRRERERGLPFQEDLYMPGLFQATLEPSEGITLIATTEPYQTIPDDGEAALRRRRARDEEVLGHFQAREGVGYPDDPFFQQLVLAADQFLVVRPTGPSSSTSAAQGQEAAYPEAKTSPAAALLPSAPQGRGRPTAIAGYHWFTDWGRDTIISLPGLALVTGRYSEARDILRAFATYTAQGILPNHFPDQGEEPGYNTVDAALWYFQALHQYLTHTGDWALLDELYPTLAEIVDWYRVGTRHHIHVDPADGLVVAGEPGGQLTWMDAKVGDWVVTPRVGKPVEVNALWYNALVLMAGWAKHVGQLAKPYDDMAAQVRDSFGRRFWFDAGGYLYDVVDGPVCDDTSLRPNQILAVALPHSPLSPAQAQRVVDIVGARLLTPYGLRTLAPEAPAYVGRYEGDQSHRDAAYHQGTVWPWLIGPYVDAYLRVYGDTARARALLAAFRDHLAQAGLGSISEIFDGDPPHAPRGCIAQAWSVAEVLRAWVATASTAP